MNKTKLVIQLSNQILKEKYSEGLSDIEVLNYIKSFEPKNYIEKRVAQRCACIVGGYIKMNGGEFVNNNLLHLLSKLK